LNLSICAAKLRLFSLSARKKLQKNDKKMSDKKFLIDNQFFMPLLGRWVQ